MRSNIPERHEHTHNSNGRKDRLLRRKLGVGENGTCTERKKTISAAGNPRGHHDTGMKQPYLEDY